MIRKYKKIIFSLFINIVFVAHVVIPHHHHIEQEYISDIQCETKCNDQKSLEKHGHEHESNSQHCLLNNFMLFGQDSVKKQFKNYTNSRRYIQDTSNNDLFFFSSTFQYSVPIKPVKINDRHNTSFFKDRILLLSGLRAPPIV